MLNVLSHMHTIPSNFFVCGIYMRVNGGVMLLKGAHERRKGNLKGERLYADEFSVNSTQARITWEDGTSVEKTLPTDCPVGKLVSNTLP